jgi:hypothetical protein
VGTGITWGRRSSRVKRDGLKAARAIVEVLPGSFRFVDMRIYVYS